MWWCSRASVNAEAATMTRCHAVCAVIVFQFIDERIHTRPNIPCVADNVLDLVEPEQQHWQKNRLSRSKCGPISTGHKTHYCQFIGYKLHPTPLLRLPWLIYPDFVPIIAVSQDCLMCRHATLFDRALCEYETLKTIPFPQLVTQIGTQCCNSATISSCLGWSVMPLILQRRIPVR